MDDKKSLASKIKSFISCVPSRASRVTNQSAGAPIATTGVYTAQSSTTGVYTAQTSTTATVIPWKVFSSIEPSSPDYRPSWDVMRDSHSGDDYHMNLVATPLYASRWIRLLNRRNYGATDQATVLHTNDNAITCDSNATSPRVVR